MSVSLERGKRLYDGSGHDARSSALLMTGSLSNPFAYRHLLRPVTRTPPETRMAITPPQNGKPTSIAQLRETW
jgi:hypothetical protein